MTADTFELLRQMARTSREAGPVDGIPADRWEALLDRVDAVLAEEAA